MPFTEEWYSDDQIRLLTKLATHARQLEGAVIEIGCWEGRSTVALARACAPDTVHAVDTWEGNLDEGEDHPTVQVLRERDVLGTFRENVATMTPGNVEVHQDDCLAFLARWDGPIKFCHVDASHDYTTVKRTLELLLPNLVPGAVVCGDDYVTSATERLGGGVPRACLEVFPTHHFHTKNFWFWRKDA